MKNIKWILFDLDGTLLPMDQDAFVKGYLKELAKTFAPAGYDPQKLVSAIWAGTGKMVKNTGEKNNEEVFWDDFKNYFGEKGVNDKERFNDFYRNEFQKAKEICGFNPKAAEMVHWLKEQGYRVALATNPLFPRIATESRIRWAGLEPEDFELITTYENSWHCKPNPEYYLDILRELGTVPEECMMVGNDVKEDMVPACGLGMKSFLLTDCLINSDNLDMTIYPQGDFEQLCSFVKEN